MRKIVLILILISLVSATKAQTRSELEELRRKNLQDIEYVDKLLKSTSDEKKENINELRVIGKKLSLREKLINEYGEEISLLEYRISLNTLALEMLESDLEQVRKDYEQTVINAYKATKGNPAVAYILSSSDFNQGYKRLKYIQQIARYRRSESQTIAALYEEMQDTKQRLVGDRTNVNDLKRKEERQKEMLKDEQGKKEKMVNSLTRKEKQLRQELDEKKRVASKIESEIARLIEEERKRSTTVPMSSEMKLIGDSFGENKGRLPWPVDRGIVTSHFGLQKHPVLKNVTEDNIGIEITSSGQTRVKAVYKGEVVRVFAISGANMAVIVRHGRYLSVYQNLVNVKVKAGDKVTTGQDMGEVYVDTEDGNKAVLKLMIYEEKAKLDPEQWLVKK